MDALTQWMIFFSVLVFLFVAILICWSTSREMLRIRRREEHNKLEMNRTRAWTRRNRGARGQQAEKQNGRMGTKMSEQCQEEGQGQAQGQQDGQGAQNGQHQQQNHPPLSATYSNGTATNRTGTITTPSSSQSISEVIKPPIDQGAIQNVGNPENGQTNTEYKNNQQGSAEGRMGQVESGGHGQLEPGGQQEQNPMPQRWRQYFGNKATTVVTVETDEAQPAGHNENEQPSSTSKEADEKQPPEMDPNSAQNSKQPTEDQQKQQQMDQNNPENADSEQPNPKQPADQDDDDAMELSKKQKYQNGNDENLEHKSWIQWISPFANVFSGIRNPAKIEQNHDTPEHVQRDQLRVESEV